MRKSKISLGNFFILSILILVFTSICGFVFNKIFTTILDRNSFGILITIKNLENSISNIIALGLGTTIVRYSKSYEKQENLIYTVLYILLILNTLFFTILILLNFFNVRLLELNDYTSVLILMYITISCKLILYVFNSWAIANHSTFLLTITSLIPKFLIIIFGYLFIKIIGNNTLLIIFGILLGNVIPAIISLIYYNKNKRIGKFDRNFLKILFEYSGPTTIVVFVSRFLESIVTIILFNNFGAEESSLYGISISIVSSINILYKPINMTFTPYVFRKYDNGHFKELNNILKFFIKLHIIFSLTIFLLFNAFSPLLITIFSNEDYLNAVNLIKILSFGIIVYNIKVPISWTYQFKKKMINLSIRHIIASLICIALSNYIIKKYGSLGATIIFSLNYVLTFIFVIKDTLNLYEYKANWLEEIYISLIFLISYIFFNLIFHPFNRSLNFIFSLILFLFVLYLFKLLNIKEIKEFLTILFKKEKKP